MARLVWYRRLSRFLTSRENQLAWWLEHRRPPGLFQPFGETAPDRYPRLFDCLRDHLTHQPMPRLLSFGCARGDEVFSLAKRLPTAQIRGIDIAAARINACRQQWRQQGEAARISFVQAANTTDEPTEHYDAVCALAVFRHGRLNERPASCQPWLTFNAFDQAVTDLVRILKPGGLLAIRQANFRLMDSRVAGHLTPIWHATFADGPASPIYGRDDRLIAGAIGDDGVYRKHSGDAA